MGEGRAGRILGGRWGCVWYIPTGAPAHRIVKKEQGSGRRGCFLNSIHGNNKSLSNTNQLTSYHLPSKRWRWWGGWGMQREDRALPVLAQENFILSKHRPPGGRGRGTLAERERRCKRKDMTATHVPVKILSFSFL